MKRPADRSNVEPRPQRPKRGCFSRKGNLLKKVCIFCERERKKISGSSKFETLLLCNTNDGRESIKKFIYQSDNHRLKGMLIEGDDLMAREAHYHKTCMTRFYNEIKKKRML